MAKLVKASRQIFRYSYTLTKSSRAIVGCLLDTVGYGVDLVLGASPGPPS
jgi:hypothetical protein